MAAFAGTQPSDFFPALKEWTEDFDTINQFLFEDNPTMGLLPQKTVYEGKYVTVPFMIAANAAQGANFNTMYNNQTSGQYREFQIPLSKYYGFGCVDGLTAELSRTNKGAFEQAFKSELEACMIQYADNVSSLGIWGLGSGVRGTFTGNTGITTGVITLTYATDAIKFNLGMALQCFNAGTPIAAPGYVVAVNYSGGTITVSTSQFGAPANPVGWNASATLSLAVIGDYNNLMLGIPAWIVGALPGQVRPGPTATSAQNTLFGVDRSVNPDWMAGVYLSLTNYSMKEAMIQALMQAKRIGGGKPDIIVCNDISHAELSKELEGQRQYIDLEGPTGFTYKAMTVMGSKGPVGIVPDRYCPSATMFGLELDTLKLCSAGPLGRPLTYDDGISWFRSTDQDAYQLRYGGYPALYVNKPGRNFCANLAV